MSNTISNLPGADNTPAPSAPATPAQSPASPGNQPASFQNADSGIFAADWDSVKSAASGDAGHYDVAQQSASILATLAATGADKTPKGHALAVDLLGQGAAAKGVLHGDKIAFMETYLHHATPDMQAIGRDLLASKNPKSGDALKAWTNIITAGLNTPNIGEVNPAITPKLVKDLTDKVLRGELTPEAAGAMARAAVDDREKHVLHNRYQSE